MKETRKTKSKDKPQVEENIPQFKTQQKANPLNI